MSTLLSASLSFLNPWILAGLAGLPILWFLLRVTPPAPKILTFPAARFLAGLVPERPTPATTPLWLLLLRCLILALVIFALAGPVLNKADTLPGNDNVRLVIDNGWDAAQGWAERIGKAEELAARAARAGKDIYVLATAPNPGLAHIAQHGPFAEAQALSHLRGLKPQPWPPSYRETLKTVQDSRQAVDKSSAQTAGPLQSFWLGTGLDHDGFDRLAAALQSGGSLHYVEPAPANLPVLLRPAPASSPSATLSGIAVVLEHPAKMPGAQSYAAHIIGKNGRILDRQTFRSEETGQEKNTLGKNALARFTLPESLRNDAVRIALAGRQAGAGGVLLVDEKFRRRSVGIAAARGETEAAPLTRPVYFLRRALEPYADLHIGDLPDIMENPLSVIILPDIGAMPPSDLEALESWVRGGGLLLRFAGPAMSQAAPFLTPVPLRKEARTLEGRLTWEKPQRLAPFPENSPLYGIDLPDQVTVKSQILPESADIDKDKIWAALEDGTPLITASALDQGMLVLIHTTAGPEWSDLALSGTYVEILRRLVSLSAAAKAGLAGTAPYEPLTMLDGFGQTTDARHAKPIPADSFETILPGPFHPPGLYAQNGSAAALNLGAVLPALKARPALPAGVMIEGYDGPRERSLAPLLLSAAFILFLLDWLVMMALRGAFSFPRPLRALLSALSFSRGALKGSLKGSAQKSPPHATPHALVLFVVTLSAFVFTVWPSIGAGSTARAAETREDRGPTATLSATQQDVSYAANLHLAYVPTNIPAIDQITQSGLESLAAVLSARTSVEPAGVVPVDPEKDELAFFPFIFWPIGREAYPLSDTALRKIQHYLDHGGTLFFDTRDQSYAISTSSGFGATRNALALRDMIGSLNIPPLEPIPQDHVLTKSFYLLSDFPGRYNGGILWVEDQSAQGRDGVSSVIIGSHDWAAAWAAGKRGDQSAAIHLSAGARQQEMALRFGINLVMYTLTGNYKSDQVHLPYILERLDQ